MPFKTNCYYVNQVYCTRLASTLIIADHRDGVFDPITLCAITAGKQLGHELHCLVLGPDTKVTLVAKQLSKAKALSKVIVGESFSYKGLLPEYVAPTVVELQKSNNYTHIVAGASAFGKNVMPRIAGLLDVAPISDIIGIKDDSTFIR